MQKKSLFAAAGDNVRLNNDGHEMVVPASDDTDAANAIGGGLDSPFWDGDEDSFNWNAAGEAADNDEFSYDRWGQMSILAVHFYVMLLVTL